MGNPATSRKPLEARSSGENIECLAEWDRGDRERVTPNVRSRRTEVLDACSTSRAVHITSAWIEIGWDDCSRSRVWPLDQQQTAERSSLVGSPGNAIIFAVMRRLTSI